MKNPLDAPRAWSDRDAIEYAKLVFENLQSIADGESEPRGHNRLLYAKSRAEQLIEWLKWRLDEPTE